MNGKTTCKRLRRHKRLAKPLWNYFQKDKVSNKQLTEWFALLKDLLDSGFSLKQAVCFSANLEIRTAQLGQKVDHDLSAGQSLAGSLKGVIPVDVYYQLYLAEKHGSLRSSLNAISMHYLLKEKEKQRLEALLAYPCMLLALLALLFLGIKIFIAPQISALSVKEPTSLRTISIYLLSALGSIGLVVLLRFIHFRKQDQLVKIEMLSHLPIIGKLFSTYYSYYVCDGLSLMLSQGMSLQEICDSLSQYKKDSLFFQLAHCYCQLNHDLGRVIDQLDFLPKEVKAILNRGLTTQEIGDQLAMLARMKFSQLGQLYEKRLAMVQPALFGVISLAIVGMYLSILLPIYQCMQGVLP